MSNVTPMQMRILNGELSIEYSEDSIRGREDILALLKMELGDSFSDINYRKGQRVVTGVYENYKHQKTFVIVANLTFMGGKEGQHPKDLKRIQYNVMWRDFYEDYSSMGRVLWLGLYSYKDLNVWAFFEPESYLSKHINSKMLSKGGHKAQYSCHIFLNDLYQGYENDSFSKIDKNNNTVGAVKPGSLKDFLDNDKPSENPIIETIVHINNDIVDWNKWITADRAITYMRGLQGLTGFKQWKQNMWNGWYIEALYSEYFYRNPSAYVDYIATSINSAVKEEYSDCGLDLAFPEKEHHFVGDLKAVCEGDGNTLLNDESKVKNALKKYKKVWFIIYIHDKRKGNTNDYEMVKWRNQFILDQGAWDYRNHPIFDPLSAPRTPHSVSYTEMVIIELNEITKSKYFSIGPQWGLNSDGNERNDKFRVSKKMLEEITDDSFVVYRYRPA